MEHSWIAVVFTLGGLAYGDALQCYECDNCPASSLKDSDLLTCDDLIYTTSTFKAAGIFLNYTDKHCTCSGISCDCNENNTISEVVQYETSNPYVCVTLTGKFQEYEIVRGCFVAKVDGKDACSYIKEYVAKEVIDAEIKSCSTCDTDKCNNGNAGTMIGSSSTTLSFLIALLFLLATK